MYFCSDCFMGPKKTLSNCFFYAALLKTNTINNSKPVVFMMSRTLGTFLFLLMVTSTYALDVKEMTWATPEWENLTQKDGKGLFNEIVFKAFEHSHIKVRQQLVPWKRADYLVKNNKADMYGGLDPTKEYPQSKYPISVIVEGVTFLPEVFGPWKGVESLDSKKGVWVSGYIDYINDSLKKHLKGIENNTRESALHMVEYKRVDYYFDNLDQTKDTFRNTQIDRSKYKTEIVSRIWLYMTFCNNKRGRFLKMKYDEGVEYLINTNQLKPLYIKYDNEYPIIETRGQKK